MDIELKTTNIGIDFIGLYNYIRVLGIGPQIQEDNTPATDKDQVDNYIKTFVIDGNDSNEEIQKRWLSLKPINRLSTYGLVLFCIIILGIQYSLSLKTFHTIEEESVRVLSNLIPTNIHPLLHKYVLSGNFIFTLLQIVSGSYIVLGLIESVYWILRKSKDITSDIMSTIFLCLFSIVCIKMGCSLVAGVISLILIIFGEHSIISNIIVYGYLLIVLYGVCSLLNNIYKKKHSDRYIGEYIVFIIYTMLLIMSITAIIYIFSDNIVKIIEYSNDIYTSIRV
ncbi:hypothetical protein NEIRO03_2313 [Nematocida sp. AWRm78]|nr:hypothetical protein NEIRO02_2296 [Nematocida sp. AWRm79]KAI5186544.1 hypothetical protein NEIRO03_2313 [Nematocida sp. AWRm78]